jgi:hypothetical protein
MGRIVKGRNGSYRCDGRYCGFPLAWHPPCPEEGESGVWVCLDCGASMYGEPVEAAYERRA